MEDQNKPFKTVALLGRAPGMTFQQFDDYWRNVHAPLAAKLPGVTKYTPRIRERGSS